PQRAGGVDNLAAALFGVVKAARNDAAFGAIKHGGFLRDDTLLVGFKAGMIERAPPERMAGLNDFVKRFAFAFAEAHGLLRAQVGAHDFEQGAAPAADFGHQPLADNPAQ